MDLSKLSTSDKVISIGGLVLFIAAFLPWFTADYPGDEFFRAASYDANGWDVGFIWAGVPGLLGLAAAGVILATKLGSAKVPDLPISWGQAFLFAGGLSAVLVVLKLLVGEDAPTAFELAGGSVDRSWGLFVATIAALAFAAGGYLKFQEEKAAPPANGPSVF